MSDLQCAVRVFVARHAEAEYESDLVTDDGGSLTARGRGQARALGESLRDARIGRIYTSPLSRAVQTAEIAAAVLGVEVIVREGLREYGVGALAGSNADEAAYVSGVFRAWLDGDAEAGIEGGEQMTAIVARVASVLDEIADLHRGESVLAVSHGGAICTGVPALARNLHPAFPEGRSLPNCGVIELAGDTDGWLAVAWLRVRLAPGR